MKGVLRVGVSSNLPVIAGANMAENARRYQGDE